jgi:hypothetical protein
MLRCQRAKGHDRLVQGGFSLCLPASLSALNFQDGQPIPNDVRFKTDDSEVSLEISDVKAQDAGIYECGKFLFVNNL